MSVLATDKKLISFGTDYSAGSGISIIDHTISIVPSAVGKTYSAGPNIGIYDVSGQPTISSKDWSNEISDASAGAVTQSTSYFNDWVNGQYTGDITNITNNLTALSGDLSSYYKKTETSSKEQISDAIQYVSAHAVGDVEVNNYVHNNSATIDAVNSAYQANSASYITAHQSLEGYATESWVTSQGYITGVNIPESATWNETSNVVSSNSASWSEGKTYEGISPIVVNNTENKISADTWVLSAGDGVSFTDDSANKVTRIDVTAKGGNYIPYTATNTGTFPAFETNSGLEIRKLENGILNSTYISPSTIQIRYLYSPIGASQIKWGAVLSNSELTFDSDSDSAYVDIEKIHTWDSASDYIQTISGTYYPKSNPSSFTTESWVTAQGYLTAHQDISNKLDSSAFSSVSGDFLTTSFSIPESGVWNDTSNVVQTNSAQWAEGGGTFDTTYMSAQIDNKLNKSEIGFRKVNSIDYVSGISGKNISAKFAYRANTAYNADHANTASYDDNGNSLTTTYYNAQEANNKASDLFNFVQSNSANWGGGSSPSVDNKVLFYKNYSYDPSNGSQNIDTFVSGATELYFEAAVDSQQSTPSEIVLYRNGNEIGRAYWSQVSSDGSYNYLTASYNNADGGNIQIQNYNGTNYNNFVVSANGVKTLVFYQGLFDCATDKEVKFNINGFNIVGQIYGWLQGVSTPLTSFTGGLTDFTAKGYNKYDTNINSEDSNNSHNYNVSAEFGGSSIAGGGGFYSESAILFQGSKYDSRTTAWSLNDNISNYKMIQCDWIDTNNYFVSKQIPIPSGLGYDMTRAAFFDAVFEYGSDLWCKAQRFSAQNNTVYAQVDEYCVHTNGTISNVGSDVENNRPIMVQIIGVK